MKKKIVYISGAESFNIEDVRAAFDEVRSTLKLDSDTLLFGVPVEEFVSDAVSVSANMSDSVTDTPNLTTVDEKLVDEEVVNNTEFVPETPKKQRKNTKKEKVIDLDKAPKETVEPMETVQGAVPILSVLAPNMSERESEPEQNSEETDDFMTEDDDVIEMDDVDELPQDVQESELQEVEIKAVETSDDDIPEMECDEDIEQEDVADMINDEMPADDTEKTLETLLETMEPLREDVQPEIKSVEFDADNQSDTTLESLASEFVENQDNFLPQKKNNQRSKIGKLKNILPFKKMKREDPGIMGDLFGWAGIAANDEDFAMPGFFTGVASKK